MVRDSAGIEIIENHAQTWRRGQEWRLSLRPILSLGMLDGPEAYQFFGVMGARRLADGRIAVANAGSSQLRFYARSGAFLNAVGGKGAGPGEFETIYFMQPLGGDTLAVYDPRLHRFSFIHTETGAITSIQVPLLSPDQTIPAEHLLASGGVRLPVPRGVMRDGSILVWWAPGYGPAAQAGLHQDSIVLVRYDPTTGSSAEIGRFPGSDSYVEKIPDGIFMPSLPFSRGPHGWAGAEGFIFGHSSRYEIGYYGPDGTLQRLIRREVEPRPVTPQDMAEVRERRLADVDDRHWRRRIEQALATMPIPASHPVFHDLVLDDVGNLWVLESRSDTASEWSVFGRNGHLLGTLAMPRGFGPTHIGDEYVVGVYRDEMQVEYVHMYELVKPGTS